MFKRVSFILLAALMLSACDSLAPATATPIPTPTPTVTASPTPTQTPGPSATPTQTLTPAPTVGPPTLPPSFTPTATFTASATRTATPTPSLTPTPGEADVCAALEFPADLIEGRSFSTDGPSTFFVYVQRADSVMRWAVRNLDTEEETISTVPGNSAVLVAPGQTFAPGRYEWTVTVSTPLYSDICATTARFEIVAPTPTPTPTADASATPIPTATPTATPRLSLGAELLNVLLRRLREDLLSQIATATPDLGGPPTATFPPPLTLAATEPTATSNQAATPGDLRPLGTSPATVTPLGTPSRPSRTPSPTQTVTATATATHTQSPTPSITPTFAGD